MGKINARPGLNARVPILATFSRFFPPSVTNWGCPFFEVEVSVGGRRLNCLVLREAKTIN